jgi:hypothetical protein
MHIDYGIQSVREPKDIRQDEFVLHVAERIQGRISTNPVRPQFGRDDTGLKSIRICSNAMDVSNHDEVLSRDLALPNEADSQAAAPIETTELGLLRGRKRDRP